MKREEELSVICIKVVVKGKGGYQSIESGSVHYEEKSAKNKAFETTREEL